MHSFSYQTFFRYISCNVLGMVGLSFYILADTFFVSKAAGANGLAALNYAIPAYTAMSATGLMLGVGGATRATMLRSRNEPSDAIFPNILLLGSGIGILFSLAGLFAAEPIAKLLGANGETLPLTVSYLRILLLYGPAFLLNQILLAFVRNDNNPQLAMTAMLAGSLSNIVLDYFFMFPLHLGMTGAAIATGCSPLIGIAVLLLHFRRKNRGLRLTRCRVQGKEWFAAAKLGISSWITEISSGIVLLAFNWIIFRIAGNIGVAAYGIIANIALVETAVYTGVAQGVQPLISRAAGTGNEKLVRQYQFRSCALAVLLSGVLYLIVSFWAEPIVGIFAEEENALLTELAQNGVRLYFWGFFFAGINIILAAASSASDHPTIGFWISLLRGCFFILPLVLLLSHFWNMTGVWLSFPFCEILTLIVGSICVKSCGKNRKIVRDRQENFL